MHLVFTVDEHLLRNFEFFFRRGVGTLSTVVFVKLKDLKLSLSSAQTFEDFSLVVDRLLPLLLF